MHRGLPLTACDAAVIVTLMIVAKHYYLYFLMKSTKLRKLMKQRVKVCLLMKMKTEKLVTLVVEWAAMVTLVVRSADYPEK